MNTGTPDLHGNKRLVEILIEARANINAKGTDDGNTPLHLAVKNGDANMVALLLSYDADTALVNKRGETPVALVSPDRGDITKLFQDKARVENWTLSEENSPPHDKSDNNDQSAQSNNTTAVSAEDKKQKLSNNHYSIYHTSYLQWFPRDVLETTLELPRWQKGS